MEEYQQKERANIISLPNFEDPAAEAAMAWAKGIGRRRCWRLRMTPEKKIENKILEKENAELACEIRGLSANLFHIYYEIALIDDRLFSDWAHKDG